MCLAMAANRDGQTSLQAIVPPRTRAALSALLVAVLIVIAIGTQGLWQALETRPAQEADRNCAPGERCAATAAPAAVQAQIARLPGREPVDPALAIPSIMSPDAARSLNAATPFADHHPAAARPFRFAAAQLDRGRAETCLAAAMLYEAGLDADGQKAVAQVVLNRVRHPAFPKTVCGVVFEGSERATGCQFTFTCDGSLTRHYATDAWDRARTLARAMMDGKVDPRVGLATHYHTDWVYPYWSPSLDKIAAVGTHLFFRWRGYWGTPPAFTGRAAGQEPLIARLHPATEDITAAPDLAGSEAGQNAGRADAPMPAGLSPGVLRGNMLKLVHPDGGAFGLLLRPGATATDLSAAARDLCGADRTCRVMAWQSVGDIPNGFPIPPAATQKLAFLYLRDRQWDIERVALDCRLFGQGPEAKCLN